MELRTRIVIEEIATPIKATAPKKAKKAATAPKAKKVATAPKAKKAAGAPKKTKVTGITKPTALLTKKKKTLSTKAILLKRAKSIDVKRRTTMTIEELYVAIAKRRRQLRGIEKAKLTRAANRLLLASK